MIAVLIAATAIAVAAGVQAAPDGDIIGYHYVCKATVATRSGTLTAQRFLERDSAKLWQSDSATWLPHSYAGLSISWSHSFGRNALPLSRLQGAVQMFITTAQRLPPVTIWTISRDKAPGTAALALATTTRAAKRMASTIVPLDVLLDYAGATEELFWTLDDGRTRSDGIGRRYAEGRLDTPSLREAAGAVITAAAKLDEMAASPATRCALEAEHYDPNSEI